jgi:acetyltransferase-like isoleucine patch superfamily enzyme
MKAYILPSGVTITPFGEPAAESLIVFERLSDIQDRVFRDQGVEPVRIQDRSEIRDTEYFLTYDNVFVTRRAFRDFFARAVGGKKTCVLAIPDSEFARRYTALQDVAKRKDAAGTEAYVYNIWYINGGSGDLGAAEPLVVAFREKVWEQPVPPNMFKKKTLRQPVTTSIAFHITHWVTLLWANQMGIMVRWVEQITDHPVWTAWKLFKALVLFISTGVSQILRLDAFSAAFGRPALIRALMRSFVKVGRNCDIHPDAIVEMCILGDNVTIGPQSYVRASILGDGVIVEEKTKITFTSLGPGCYASQLTVLNGVAAYPDGDVCIDGMQFSLSGRNVRLTGLVRPMDIRTDGPIKVIFKGKAEPIGQEILGSCFGHECFIGPEVYIAPGREIPNGAVIIQPPGRVLQKIPEGARPGVPMVIEAGTLRPHDPEKDNR